VTLGSSARRRARQSPRGWAATGVGRIEGRPPIQGAGRRVAWPEPPSLAIERFTTPAPSGWATRPLDHAHGVPLRCRAQSSPLPLRRPSPPGNGQQFANPPSAPHATPASTLPGFRGSGQTADCFYRRATPGAPPGPNIHVSIIGGACSLGVPAMASTPGWPRRGRIGRSASIRHPTPDRFHRRPAIRWDPLAMPFGRGRWLENMPRSSRSTSGDHP
jgi:hypothetical protein